MPIAVPKGVTVTIQENKVTVKGPKGELSRTFHRDMSVNMKDDNLVVSRPSDSRLHRSLHGLTRTLLANMVEGVSRGFERGLDITGLGFRTERAGDKLIVRVGYSHPVEISPLPGVSLAVEGVNRIKILGVDKEVVGEMADKVRAIHPPDGYKGKGIRYSRESIRLKPGKAGKVAEKK